MNNLMEKRAVDLMTEITVRRPRHMLHALLTSRLWIVGFSVGVVAIGFLVISYSLAPTVIVQSTFGAGVVLLVLASRRYLGEHLTRKEHQGLAVIVVALVCVSTTIGVKSSPSTIGSSMSVLVVSMLALAAAGLTFRVLMRTLKDPSVTFGITSGLLYGVATLQTKAVSVLIQRHGDLGAIPVILSSPYPYVFIVASILGLLTFQTGLQRCRIAVVGPVTNIVASIFVVAVGMAIFGEALPRNPLLTFMRILGFALVLVGSWILAVGPASIS
jgi:multidrug transporter EmrE-like cation transporter